MDESTAPNTHSNRRNDLIRIYFCRKLLSEAFLSPGQLYPPENTQNDRQPETPLSKNVEGPMELNGNNTPNPQPNTLQHLLNQHSDALTLRLENSIMTPKTWNCGVYSPIEVYIDSPSGVDNSEQASTLLSSMSDDVSTASDLFEMDVLERINRLRRQGKWSLTRLPLCLDAPRPKTHMDYLLEECMMMQTDFVMERETKRLAAKMLAHEAKRYVQNKRKNNVINLCRTSSNTRKSKTVDGLISSLPSDYIGDLRSRLSESSNDLFKEFLTSKEDKWDIVERVCSKISTTKPTSNFEDFDVKLRILACTLRPYQLAALKWFINAYDNSFGCILSDDEKLGKKTGILGFLAYLEEYRKVSGPHLIVSDEAANWTILLERFLPNSKILVFSEQEENLPTDFQICLVDYETYFSDLFADAFGNSFFQVQIIDKAELLEFLHEKPLDYLFEENPLHGNYRFRILLGNCEFLEQTFEDQKFMPTLLMLLQLLLPKSLQYLLEDKLNEEAIGKLTTKNLLSLLQSFQLSRTKAQVSDQIPSSSFEIIKCNMSLKQYQVYERLLQMPNMKQELTSNKPIQAMDILRKVCSHPFLIDGQSEVKTPAIISLYYPILRQAFLDIEETICLQNYTDTQIQTLQSPNLLFVREHLESLVRLSYPNVSKLYFYLYPTLASSIFNFTGKYDCSLLTIWQRNRSKQLANELFFKRSTQEDEILSIGCLSLPDKNQLLLNSGKLQELFKILINVRRRQQRCVIFTNYESTQNLLCEILAYHNFTYMVLSDESDRREFLEKFNKNQRIGCVLASTRNSLYRLNFNNIGAVVMLETDWEIEYNDNIKRFYNKCIQSAGAGFYNLITNESLETRTNLFEIDVRPNLLDIGRSITSESANKKIESKEYQNEQNSKKDLTLTEFILPYAPIYCNLDGEESVSDTLSTSGYEGSLDDNTSLHAEPLTYDRNFLESDTYLSSMFGLNWRYNLNNQDKYVFTEEAQMFDSFSNLWYSGEVIEPDEIEYTKLSPPEQQIDEDTLFEYGDEQENNYLDSRALSPKSTDDLVDLSTPPASTDASRMSTEFSLDPAIQIAHRPAIDQDHDSRLALKKTAQRLQSRSDELRRKLLETQAIVLPDPEPLFRPDGKSGYMPPRFRTEWVDSDSPTWTYIEDHALLALTVKQLRAIPIPSYISRNFCVNWNLIAFDLDKVSFQKRTPNQCCTRYRELISKKFPPVESPTNVVEQFEEIDLSLMKDQRVISSVQYSTRCFNRSVATLARKLEDLKRIRNTWQARTNWLNSCDDDENFDILKRLTNREDQEINNAADSTRIHRLMDNVNRQPSKILTQNKKSLPLDMVMVYHQYSRGIRLSRVLTAAKSFMVKALKRPAEFGRVPGYNESISFNNRRIFVVDNGSWKVRVVSALSEFNHHSHKVPKIQKPIESRLLWVDCDSLSLLDRKLDARIFQLLQSNFMQYTVDIRSNMMTSRKLTFEIVQIASKFIPPKMPKKPKNLKKTVFQREIEIDIEILNDVKETLKNGSEYRVMKNGNSLLPIKLTQNNSISYPPLLLLSSSPLKHHINSDILPLFFTNMTNELKNDVYSISKQFEDFLLDYQDYSLMCKNNKENQLPVNSDCRLFAKSYHSNLILKIGQRAINKKSSNGKYVISCVPGDHFELHQVIEQKRLPTEISKMDTLIGRLESAPVNFNSILTINKKYCQELPELSSFTSPISSRLQRQLIQKYLDENLQKSTNSLNFLPKNNNYELKLETPTQIIKTKVLKKREVNFEDFSPITRLDSNDFLISTSNSTPPLSPIEVYADIDEEITKSDGPISAVVICANRFNVTRNENETTPKGVKEFCRQMQRDESCITTQNLKIINQIYKLSQNSVKFVEESKVEFKLPRPTINELSKLRDFMKSRFVQPESKSPKPLFIDLEQKELNSLINRHFTKFSSELKHQKKEVMSTVALKLQLKNSTPQFTNILPINPSKFDVEYKGRVLHLRYQSAVQQERLNITTDDGTKLSLEIECIRSETSKPTKAEADHPSTTCLALEKPTIKATLINFLMKMPNLERQKWFDAIKHRYLRISNFQQKQKALRSIDKMHKTIDQILKENNHPIEKDDKLTESESKKLAIKSLIGNPETKFPPSLDTFKNSHIIDSSASTKTPIQLANLLIQTAAKTQINICEKLHPTFEVIENWKEKEEEVLKISYKDGNKSLIVFDKKLENFYKNVNLSTTFFEDKPIEYSNEIYDHLLSKTTFAPSKIIKFRSQIEQKDPNQPNQQSKDAQKQEIFDGNSTNEQNKNFEQNQQTMQTDYDPNQQNDPNRERSLPTIPSAMQVPASAVYHLNTDNHGNLMNQPVKTMDQVYYTKRNPSISGSSENTQRQTQSSEPYQHSSSAPPSVHDNFRKDIQMMSKTGPNRQVIRQVVVGNRQKTPNDQQGNNFQSDHYHEDNHTQHDNRYYQPAPGQRELTVREKLQRDLAMGVVQTTTQKKLYPVRMPTNVKRKLSENQQQFGDESAPKRGRTQYVYQGKNSMPSGSSFINQQTRPPQISSNVSLSNQSEQQTTSQTVPMIYHHGEPIKTYIRRENHQFAIHEPANYPQPSQTSQSSTQQTQNPNQKASSQKMYEKHPASTTSNPNFPNSQQSTLSKSKNELLSNAEKSSNST